MIRLLIILLMLSSPARAGLTQAEIDQVAVDLPAGAALPLGLDLPAVLLFADFDCQKLCDAMLGQTAELLGETGLVAGEDYRLVIVGLDPRDSAEDAKDYVERQASPEMLPAITLLQPDEERLAQMTEALGYGYVFDEEFDAFAHPAAPYVLAADGSVSGVLPAFAASAAKLRETIIGARLGTGATATRLILLCYGFDPVTGRYSLAIWRVLTVLSLFTLALLAGALATAFWRERRRA